MRKKTVPVGLLKFGMYVHELDRPWTDTPFMFQGFVLRNMEQLDALKKYCKFVYVDFDRSELSKDAEKASLAQPAQSANRLPPEPKVSVEHELVSAGKAYSSSKVVLEDAFAAVRAGKLLEPGKMKEAVAEITDSVMRNPDALQLFSRLEEKGEYTLGHALDVSVYMSTFGRFLEMDHDEIVTLGYLGLLQDIGKLKVPNNLIEKRDRLNTEEFEEAKKHVQYSIELLESTPNLPPELPRLAALHHERYDGSGYPNGLKGDQIGKIGAIAAIVDTFDALTMKRPYAEPVAPSAALSMLYKWRGAFFDSTLVEQFIRCIGVFPVGSVVELNSGEVGIVFAQNYEKRLQPRVMVIRDA
ncbi:MAG: HD-GYP domain-containing protein, partial [Betaproteobacteria bacterium]|nr:HD-GYP domain-containing protein [Betaproteobacteria bacterium]